jgi:uncharacterized membrane protein YphA (DoxX/SURF4 family)
MQIETHSDRIVRSVWWTLRLTFGLIPVVAGLDKFLNLLVHWDKYIAPVFARMLPMSPTALMQLAGVIEIAAGLLVLLTPWQKIFGWVVAGWLWLIAVNLLAGGWYDIAVRDVVMGISAATLAVLSLVVPVEQRSKIPIRRHVERPAH